ncbi:MAG: hypothetical protein LBD05_01245 [Mycoplasmataceae bacterium]|jgi:transposase-like protein|nr:hypothetical protein [Mycoplasmataceae bacterium]
MGKRGPKSKFTDVSCPNKDCDYYGKINSENIVGNGTYTTKNGKVHKFHCKACKKDFTSNTNTILHELKTDEKIVFLALKMILKGMTLRGTAEILEVKLDTVRRWLSIAADHSEMVNKLLMKELNVDKVELDELWTFVKKKRFHEWAAIQKKKDGFG